MPPQIRILNRDYVKRLLMNRLFAIFLLAATPLHADLRSLGPLERIEVYPTSFRLSGSRQTLQLVVTGYRTDGTCVDLTRAANYGVDAPGLLRASRSGLVAPVGNGSATIAVSTGELARMVTLDVNGQDVVDPVVFEHHVLPALAKSGCSSGSCHGSPHGKAGFRLSLFAADPVQDWQTLVRGESQRRVSLIDPDGSLLLLKPSMKLAHQGGKRLETGSRLYTLIRDWIAAGCQVDAAQPSCMGIEVYPASARTLKLPFGQQQFSVQARYSDGSVRDVTHLATFSTSDENVVQMTPAGIARGHHRGEAAVIVRYLEFIEAPLLTIVRDIDGFEWRAAAAVNYVDEYVDQKLRDLQFLPSRVCRDEIFVRRVYLDTIGLLPTVAEVSDFLADTASDKRSRLIDRLLDRPEHAKYWAQKWGDLLRVSKRQIGGGSVHKYSRWLQRAMSENMPYDQFARELLTSTGSTLTNPAGNYFRTAADAIDAMETTAQLFLGTRIQCAKCHNHPLERWTTDHYYGLAAFFSRVQRKKTGHPEEVFLWTSASGEVIHPDSGHVMQPWVPGKRTISMPQDMDRRVALARWLTSPDNPFLARVEVNRIWTHIMGRGIVEPFDDFRDSNPPANAALLNALAEDFVRHQYDRRHIIRTILNSRTYQASSRPNPFNSDDVKYFSHYQPRRLTAEQLVDALGQLTGRPQQFEFVATGTKATWLPAPDLKPHDRTKIGDIEFLKVFGQPERQSVCECDRGDETSLSQALQLLNGQFVHEMLADPENYFRRALCENRPPEAIVRELYLRGLSRQPAAEELQACLDYLAAHQNQAAGMEDVCWALINKNEFLFQH